MIIFDTNIIIDFFKEDSATVTYVKAIKYPHDTYLYQPRRILLTTSELRPLN
jgi:predicted nucleic-acid-binding protein